MSISLKSLTHSFETQLVVNNVSLEIEDGEFFVLLGGSGSGKSTLLRMIAGLIPIESGQIILNGVDVTNLPPQKRGTGLVFQNYSIFKHLTAAQNIEFGLRIRNTPPAERAARSEELLELVGLTGLGNRYPHQLSGGQQQRVAFARALAYNPSVLLLDEPFGALDVKIRAQLRESVKQIQRQLKVTTILVTHDQEEAYFLADRIAVIELGHVVEVGRPEDLYHRPRTEYVAGFIGGGNLLVGRFVEGAIRLGGVTLPLPAGAPHHDEGSPVRVLFRPESVVQQEHPFTPEDEIVSLGKGRVVNRAFLGASERIRIEVENFQGVRALAPPLDYGVRFASIDVTLPSKTDEVTSGSSERWVGLKRYHVLDPTGLKVLAISDGTETGGPAVTMAQSLGSAARGPGTVLEVVGQQTDAESALERLNTLRGKLALDSHFNPSVRVRTGFFHREVIREAQEGSYEVIIFKRPPKSNASDIDFWIQVRKILERTHIPVLLPADDHAQVKKVLICTAGGEPGKADIRFGGRIARITGSEATVFHAHRGPPSLQERKRIERHMVQAYHFLQVMGVKSSATIVDQRVIPSLVDECQRQSIDIVVVGAPPPSHQLGGQVSGFHTSVAAKIDTPILIVPMEENS